jgi:hypothetical protein
MKRQTGLPGDAVATAPRVIEAVAVRIADRIRSRTNYRRSLYGSRILFGFAIFLAIVNAISPHSWWTIAATTTSLATLVLEGFLLAECLPRWKRTLDDWDELVRTCAVCCERPRERFESFIVSWPQNDGALTGRSVSVPVCLECGES